MIEKSIFKDGANKNLTHPRQEKGITLIALVITIIVLLILAGVTIMQLTQNKILEQAEQVKIESEIAREKEQIKIAVMAAIIEDYQKITLAELTRQLNPYTDIESVEGINTLPTGAELIAKEKNKVDVRKLLMPISYAAEETYEYAKITYKSRRIYYVKLINGNIYEDPNNISEEPVQPGNPSELYAEYFTYAYMSGKDTYEEEPDKDAFSEDLWISLKYYSSETGYVSEENYTTITGYIITGFSEEGIKAFVEGEWINIVIPKKYNNENVVAIAKDAFKHDELGEDVYTYGDKSRNLSSRETIIVPSTIKYFEENSLACVSFLGTNVKFEEGIEYIQEYALGHEGGWGQHDSPYIYLPNSLKEYRILDCYYSRAIFRFGPNTFPTNKSSFVCFYDGNMTMLENLELPSTYDEYGLTCIPYIYCIEDGKRVKYEYNPETEEYFWNEIPEDDYIYKEIENKAAEKFNFTIE